ncbi:MAG TPA: hypothetical protein VGN12_20560 [Pirellulales bacterium]|jgi:hypothetical protein
MDEQRQNTSSEPQVEIPSSVLTRQLSKPASSVREVTQLARFLYNHNPFYVISAYLVLTGLWQSFSHDSKWLVVGTIPLGLAAYTVLLAVTAWLIIRLGRVWEDARSILLIIVMMFLAISISLDPLLNNRGQRGLWFSLAGLSFAVALSESVLHGISLRLPFLFRGPYYLLLALFFLYPLAISPLSSHPTWPSLYWALFGFSTVAGAVFLTLVPAVLRGAAYLNDNGSPWRWPLYPWVLFGTLGLCVCMRAYYLCVSFLPVGGKASIFGPYFLIPFLLAVNVLYVEGAAQGRGTFARRVALILPGLLLVLAMLGHRSDPVYSRFLHRFIDALHSTPLHLTLLAVVGLYAYALVRRLPGAGNALAGAVSLLAFVAPQTMDLDGMTYQYAWPLIAVGGVQAAIGCERRDSLRTSLGAACAIAPLALGAHLGWLTPYRAIVVAHAATAAVLLVGALFHDEWARFLRIAGAGLLATGTLAAANVTPNDFPHLPATVIYLYPFVPVLIALGYARRRGGTLYQAAAAVGATVWLVPYGWEIYRQLRQSILGLDKITGGVLVFLLAATLSFFKAGLWQRWYPTQRVTD